MGKKPHTLAMRKMEKNFIAYLEKEYPRQPYREYSLNFLMMRIQEELFELEKAIVNSDWENAMNECADISNVVDYLFERLMKVTGYEPRKRK